MLIYHGSGMREMERVVNQIEETDQRLFDQIQALFLESVCTQNRIRSSFRQSAKKNSDLLKMYVQKHALYKAEAIYVIN